MSFRSARSEPDGRQHIFCSGEAVEIGDTIDTQKDTDAPRKRGRREARAIVTDVDSDSGTRRRSGGRPRGNGNGNGSGAKDSDLANLLAALRDLRDGEFSVRLESSDDQMLD